MGPAKTKLKQDVSEDCISNLPDCVLSHIQSFLPTEDVVKMSFLSKKWKSSWSPLSVLKLDFQHFSENSILDDQKKRFVEFVDRVLVLHKGRFFEELRLNIDISQFESYISNINNWVSFMVASECKTLELDFWGGKNPDLECDYWTLRHYSLEGCFFPHKSVGCLSLRHCIFKPLNHVSCSSLKVASLSVVQLPDSSVNDLLASSPCLKHIRLSECAIPAHFKVHSPESKVVSLQILACTSFKEDIQSFDINIPSLVFFVFEGNMVDKFTLNRPQNLIAAELDFKQQTDSDHEPVSDEMSAMLRGLLLELFNVKSLTMSRSCLQVYRDGSRLIDGLVTGDTITEFCPPFWNLKYLRLHCTVLDVAKLACLLYFSPNLEFLSIDLTLAFDYLDLSARYDPTSETLFSLLFPSSCSTHLKKLEIVGFEGRKHEMDLVATFLMNMPVLEKLIISKAAMKSRYANVKQAGDKEQLKLLKAYQQRTLENLLALRRGSPSAQCILS